MGRKIVGMISSYRGLNQADWLWQQTPNPCGVWDNIQMLATAANPDFLLLYNFHNFPEFKSQQNTQSGLKGLFNHWLNSFSKDQPQPDIKTLFRGVPKERIISLVREPPFAKMHQRRKAEYQYAQLYCGYVSGPDDFAPIPDYMPAIWYHANSFRELDQMGIPEKEKFCCWMTSGIDRTPEHRRRLAFLSLLRESGIDFDLYGRQLPDWAGGYGVFKNKWNVMAPYYYNLAIENYAENEWYVSEKLWDALLSWCLPIYFGGSAADKLLPPGSFLRLPSLDKKGVTYIKEVTASLDAWHDAKTAIAEARQVILHKLNLLNFISNLVEKLE